MLLFCEIGDEEMMTVPSSACSISLLSSAGGGCDAPAAEPLLLSLSLMKLYAPAPTKVRLSPPTFFAVGVKPGNMMAPRTVEATSFMLPVTLIASGELYVVQRMDEYVRSGPMNSETQKPNQNVGLSACSKVVSIPISPLRTASAAESGSAVRDV